MKTPTIVVIGAGVVGLSAAYQLARKRAGRVVLLEMGAVGDGSSRRAAGITTGLLWSETGVRARQRGLELFRELSRELEDYTYHNEQGCLNLFSPELWPARAALLPLYDRLGVPYTVMDAGRMKTRWPALHPPDAHLGLHDPQGGFSEPLEYIAALSRRVRQLGVEILEHQPVTDFILKAGRIAGVRTAQGDLAADAIVSTVHVWTLPLLRSLGLTFPIKHFVHQRYLSKPLTVDPGLLSFPPVNADPYGGYVRPAAGGRILLGIETPDREEWRVTGTSFRMSEMQAPEGLLEGAVRRFLPFVPMLAEVSWESTEVGLISFSMDGEPLLGPVDEVPGLYLGTAFHSGGFSYNTVAGLALAEWVVDGRPFMDFSAFRPSRFARQDTDAHLAMTLVQRQAVRRRH